MTSHDLTRQRRLMFFISMIPSSPTASLCFRSVFFIYFFPIYSRQWFGRLSGTNLRTSCLFRIPKHSVERRCIFMTSNHQSADQHTAGITICRIGPRNVLTNPYLLLPRLGIDEGVRGIYGRFWTYFILLFQRRIISLSGHVGRGRDKMLHDSPR